MLPGRFDRLDSVLFIITKIVKVCSVSQEFPETRKGQRRLTMDDKKKCQLHESRRSGENSVFRLLAEASRTAVKR